MQWPIPTMATPRVCLTCWLQCWLRYNTRRTRTGALWDSCRRQSLWALLRMWIWINSWWARDHSGYGLGQWEEALHSNASSHWTTPYQEWSLWEGRFRECKQRKMNLVKIFLILLAFSEENHLTHREASCQIALPHWQPCNSNKRFRLFGNTQREMFFSWYFHVYVYVIRFAILHRFCFFYCLLIIIFLQPFVSGIKMYAFDYQVEIFPVLTIMHDPSCSLLLSDIPAWVVAYHAAAVLQTLGGSGGWHGAPLLPQVSCWTISYNN